MTIIRANARRMRREPTDAERRLWSVLRNRRLAALKFRRQVPIGRYIADFVCFDRRLIVEADGSHHADNSHDLARDNWLRQQGFIVVRFWNGEVLSRPDQVIDTILAAAGLPF